MLPLLRLTPDSLPFVDFIKSFFKDLFCSTRPWLSSKIKGNDTKVTSEVIFQGMEIFKLCKEGDTFFTLYLGASLIHFVVLMWYLGRGRGLIRVKFETTEFLSDLTDTSYKLKLRFHSLTADDSNGILMFKRTTRICDWPLTKKK